MRYAIEAMAKDAAENNRIIHSKPIAELLLARYPDCGLTVRQIENQIIRQIGLARGAAEIGSTAVSPGRPTPGRTHPFS